ncbi:MAG: hypothetical protein GY719_21935 [bacterium]|nr:hypothetical protein [bacterium]
MRAAKPGSWLNRGSRVVREIENFRHQIGGYQQPLSREFRAASKKWLEVANAQFADARAVLEKEPTRQVFRAGDPVDRDNEAFIPRDAITNEIEGQVMLATGCPGLVLYACCSPSPSSTPPCGPRTTPRARASTPASGAKAASSASTARPAVGRTWCS